MRWLLVLSLALTAWAADDLQRFTAPYVFVGGGSGVVISATGEVLTNHHVIDGVVSPEQPEIPLRIPGLGELPARLVACDPVGDLALLQLQPGFPALTVAQFAAQIPAPGASVIAVGNPFALGDLDDQPTVTFGVLSTGRVVRGSYPDCVQHDAPVNPGNSGGPLFAPDGALLGITGAIRSRSGFRINSGVGLTISVPQIARFLPALRTSASGWVQRTAPPKDLTLEDRASGVVVVAGSAPLMANDVVLAVDARPCVSARSALGLFTAQPWMPAITIAVRVRRGATERELAVPAARSRIAGRVFSGFTASERAGALIVEDVVERGPAQRAGLRAGEVLLSANGAPLSNRLDLLRVTAPLDIGDLLTVRLRAADGREREAQVWLSREHD